MSEMDWRRANVFGHIASMAHWIEGEDGGLIESTKVNCWATRNDFHPAVFDAYPQIIRREGDEIIVTAANGIGRYRVDRRDFDRQDEWIPAVLIDLRVIVP